MASPLPPATEHRRHVARLRALGEWGVVLHNDALTLCVSQYGAPGGHNSWWHNDTVVTVEPCKYCDSSGTDPDGYNGMCEPCDGRGYTFPNGDPQLRTGRFAKSDSEFRKQLDGPHVEAPFVLTSMKGLWYTDPEDGLIRCNGCDTDLDFAREVGCPSECPEYDNGIKPGATVEWEVTEPGDPGQEIEPYERTCQGKVADPPMTADDGSETGMVRVNPNNGLPNHIILLLATDLTVTRRV